MAVLQATVQDSLVRKCTCESSVVSIKQEHVDAIVVLKEMNNSHEAKNEVSSKFVYSCHGYLSWLALGQFCPTFLILSASKEIILEAEGRTSTTKIF